MSSIETGIINVAHTVFITHFVKKLGILGHSIPLRDTWDNIQMTNCVVVIELLKTLFS